MFSLWYRRTKLPVESHQHQGVDGDKSSGNNEELVELTPEVTKWPGGGEGIICSSEWNTDNYEQNVSNLGEERIILEYSKFGGNMLL